MRAATGALGGAVVVYFLASRVAQQQEIGKARAAAQLALRAEVVKLRAHLSYHWRHHQVHKKYPGSFLAAAAQARFVCDMVANASELQPKLWNKVRRHLVQIFGELNVRAAEELSRVPMKDGFHPANDSDIWQAALLADFGEVEELGLNAEGSLRDFADNQLSEDKYNQVQSDLEDLLRVANGRKRLAPVGW